MGLTSTAFLIFLVMLSVITVVSCLVGWNRWRRSWVAWGFRIVSLAVLQVAAVAVVAVAINDSWGFYGSWSELLGHTPPVSSVIFVHPGSMDNRLHQRTQASFHSGHGTVVNMSIPGIRSKVGTFPAVVYLPPQYGDPTRSQVRYPVVELYGGYPGNAGNWRHQLQMASIMDDAIARGSSYPFILVAPTINVGLPRDTECVNVVHGPEVETYLTVDVRDAIIAQFRAQTDSAHWAGMGYSLGGYCALNFALRRPDYYSAAVSMSGYDRPAHDRATGELFGHSLKLHDLYTPVWRLAHLRQPAVSMLVMTSMKDRRSFRDNKAFARLVRAPARVWTLWTRSGGHNPQFWRSLEPTAFAWLSQRMSGPLVPMPAIGGQTPHPVGRTSAPKNGPKSTPGAPHRTMPPITHNPSR